MRVARGIQESLMPDTVPSVTGLDIAGGSTPALQVGGDFFGYYWRENGELGVAVGDVSGKGLPAALLMAVSVGALSAEANRSDEPEAVLDHIDTVLDDYTRRNRLNTALCYVVLSRADSDGNSFQVCAVNAGAIPPLLRRADGRVEWLEASGLPLGIPNADGAIRTPARVQIQRGDMLVLTSDGVVEAMNARRQVFGFDRFERAVAASRPERGASSVHAEILSGMHTFGAGVPPHDDVTLVVIRVV
jgi:serine phosphatase RsbU (regulator of sigma subunit)